MNGVITRLNTDKTSVHIDGAVSAVLSMSILKIISSASESHRWSSPPAISMADHPRLSRRHHTNYRRQPRRPNQSWTTTPSEQPTPHACSPLHRAITGTGRFTNTRNVCASQHQPDPPDTTTRRAPLPQVRAVDGGRTAGSAEAAGAQKPERAGAVEGWPG